MAAAATPAPAVQRPADAVDARQQRIAEIEARITRILTNQVKRRDPEWKQQELLRLRRERETLMFAATPAAR